MKVNELRVGNYVRGESDPQKRPAKIGLAELEFSHLFEGVPLTEEWLCSFGFEKTGQDRYIRCGFKLEYNEYGKYYWSESIKCSPQIKYVHEIQNLYYEIKKEEL